MPWRPSASLARAPIEVHVDPARVRPVDQPLLVADASKLRAATGWEPRFSIEQTLADMLDYWRDAVRSVEARVSTVDDPPIEPATGPRSRNAPAPEGAITAPSRSDGAGLTEAIPSFHRRRCRSARWGLRRCVWWLSLT